TERDKSPREQKLLLIVPGLFKKMKKFPRLRNIVDAPLNNYMFQYLNSEIFANMALRSRLRPANGILNTPEIAANGMATKDLLSLNKG
ncbi:hypothetical protein, partial [Staphylococcus aureus]|uniref:hypothetical protein n=1 Tax=Staphylococcus aureus TaxID=1280 RepID=UPI0038B31FBF